MNGSNSASGKGILAAALVIGVLAFFAGLAWVSPQRAWEAYLVNLLFWLGIAQGGIAVSATFYLTHARWGGSGLYRLAEAFSSFIPVGFLLFWVLFAGRALIFPWVTHPIPIRASWLNVPFMFARDGIGLAILTALSFWFLAASRDEDARRWADDPTNIERPPVRIRYLATIVLLAYTGVYTLIAWDLIMSLSALWISTLFGAYFAAGCFWSALVAMALGAVMLGRSVGHQQLDARRAFLHDIGKLVFAFSIFWVYLVFSQYIVIWYGDIPRETFFTVPRVQRLPWGALGWTALVLIWGLPFLVLVRRNFKTSPPILATICVLGLIGMWLERYVLVVPSLSRYSIPFGWLEVLVTVGFLGLFGLVTMGALERVPTPLRPSNFGGH